MEKFGDGVFAYLICTQLNSSRKVCKMCKFRFVGTDFQICFSSFFPYHFHLNIHLQFGSSTQVKNKWVINLLKPHLLLDTYLGCRLGKGPSIKEYFKRGRSEILMLQEIRGRIQINQDQSSDMGKGGIKNGQENSDIFYGRPIS